VAQPWQLAKAFKPRKSSRPILETLCAVSTTELKISSLYSGKKRVLHPLKIPHLEGVKVTATRVDFHFPSFHRGQRGRTESFRLKAIRCGFGNFRYCFHCNTCGRPVVWLYWFHNTLLCRFCCNGRHLSQAIDAPLRPVLKAHRLEQFILLTTNAQQRTRDKLLKRYGEKALRPLTNYNTHTPTHWK